MSRILLTCAKGIPRFLEMELREMRLPVTARRTAAVETEGTLQDVLRLNLWLRTAQRVHLLVREFEAADGDELYREVSGIEWENILSPDEYLSISSSVKNPTIRDTRFASLRCKDAIVDRLRDKTGKRPDSGPKTDGAVVFLHWRDRRAAVFLDTSGEPLSKRGYRKIALRAPMQEALAAAVVMAAGWRGEGNFVNPMCGSGTLAIEAALIARNRAPGSLRGNFGFMHVKGFDPAAWGALRAGAAGAERKVAGKIVASDASAEAVEAARKNAAAAGVEHDIEFSVCDYAETPVPPGGGVVVFNPEYGERLGDVSTLEPVYRGIGDFLKKKCMGCTGCVFTASERLAHKVKLAPRETLTFFNGDIECGLLIYELYAGRKS